MRVVKERENIRSIVKKLERQLRNKRAENMTKQKNVLEKLVDSCCV